MGECCESAAAAADYERETRTRAAHLPALFWFDDGGYLYDVIDGPDGEPADAAGALSLRPNQIFAVSLGAGLLDARRARAVVDSARASC